MSDSNNTKYFDGMDIIKAGVITTLLLTAMRFIYIHMITIISGKTFTDVFSARGYSTGKLKEASLYIVKTYFEYLKANINLHQNIEQRIVAIIFMIVISIILIIFRKKMDEIIGLIIFLTIIGAITHKLLATAFVGMNLIIDRMIYSFMDIRYFSFIVIIYLSMVFMLLWKVKCKSSFIASVITIIIILLIVNFTPLLEKPYNETLVQYNISDFSLVNNQE